MYRGMAASIPEVVFGGYVQGADLPPYYAAADVFVFPTLGDANGVWSKKPWPRGFQ